MLTYQLYTMTILGCVALRLCRAKMNAQIVALAVVMIVATCAAVMPAMAAEDSLI